MEKLPVDGSFASERSELTMASPVLRATWHARVARGALARVDSVEIDGALYALKRFFSSRRAVWVKEVASHLACPRSEVVPLHAYGLDADGRGWLTTPWINAHNARTGIAHGSRGLRLVAENWIADFQHRLAANGYRWTDPAPRNLLVFGTGSINSPYDFKIVDYTVRALVANPALEGCVNSLTRMHPGAWVMQKEQP